MGCNLLHPFHYSVGDYSALITQLSALTRKQSPLGIELIRAPRSGPAITRLKAESWKLLASLQHDAKARLAAHHALVGLLGLFKRVSFDHRLHACQRAELERVF